VRDGDQGQKPKNRQGGRGPALAAGVDDRRGRRNFCLFMDGEDYEKLGGRRQKSRVTKESLTTKSLLATTLVIPYQEKGSERLENPKKILQAESRHAKGLEGYVKPRPQKRNGFRDTRPLLG